VAVVEAVIVDDVVTGNVALVLPAGTVTVAGTVTPASLLDNATDVGPLEEAAVNVTVPIDDCSAVTLVGADPYTSSERRHIRSCCRYERQEDTAHM
jgi:hypothetical protein